MKYSLSPGYGGEARGEGDTSHLPPPASPELLPHGASRVRLPDGRWHFQHGPIDLIIGADGERAAVQAAVEGAWLRFADVLQELVGELQALRSPWRAASAVQGRVARRMVAACAPHRAQFITPMAAVAGAVADEMIEFFRVPGVRRAYVNNGGDIALHLEAGEAYRVGLVAGLGQRSFSQPIALDGDFEVTADMPVRGIATSGWRGRSFSLGIADSATVLAHSGAAADAAATMIANAVDVDTPAIERLPACALKDDTDLGERLVTVGVGPLSGEQIDSALSAGAQHAQALLDAGTIAAAVIGLSGRFRVVGGGLVSTSQNAPVAGSRLQRLSSV
jgi:ApbE superfamily uncharacterized protein (UPF0280 family)